MFPRKSISHSDVRTREEIHRAVWYIPVAYKDATFLNTREFHALLLPSLPARHIPRFSLQSFSFGDCFLPVTFRLELRTGRASCNLPSRSCISSAFGPEFGHVVDTMHLLTFARYVTAVSDCGGEDRRLQIAWSLANRLDPDLG